MHWILENIIFDTLHNYSLPFDFQNIFFLNGHFLLISTKYAFLWPKNLAQIKRMVSNQTSNLKLLNNIFLFVLFWHFSIRQRHITSDSLYRSPCSHRNTQYTVYRVTGSTGNNHRTADTLAGLPTQN